MDNAGQIIFQQLMTLGKTITWSWGATSYKHFSSDFFKDIPHLGGLVFKVNGFIHQGHVMIRLAPNDTYTISIGKLYKGVFTTQETFTNVYFDQMIDLIDEKVEKDPNFYQTK